VPAPDPPAQADLEEVAGESEQWCAEGGQLVQHAGQHGLQRLLAGSEQDVRVPALWHAGAWPRLLGRAVPVDDRDPIGVLGQHLRREQPGEAAAHDHDPADGPCFGHGRLLPQR
jgi:hypothetical protein